MNVTVSKNDSIKNRTLLALDKLDKLRNRWLTANESSLIERCNEQSSKNSDAVVLSILHRDFGFTPEQLREVLTTFIREYEPKARTIEFNTADAAEVEALKDIGVDLEEIYEEARA